MILTPTMAARWATLGALLLVGCSSDDSHSSNGAGAGDTSTNYPACTLEACPAAPTAWTTLTSGPTSTCAIATDASLWCWGDVGLVGLLRPAPFSNDSHWLAAAPLLSAACALTSDGSLRCSDVYDKRDLQPLGPTGAAWVSLSASFSRLCGLQRDGSLWCLDNKFQSFGSPVSFTRVDETTTWASVSVANDSTCATRTDGSLWCWGASGQPTRVDETTTWASVSAGNSHTCAIRTDGSLWCWGENLFGQVGDGTTEQRTKPTRIGTATTWSVVSAGLLHTCGLQTDGSLWCWGNPASGALGASPKVPGQVGSATTWTALSAGQNHTCGLQSDGSLWCWGDNEGGKIGDGTTTQRLEPTRVISSKL